MILLVVWDGLRPDMITSEKTPFLHRMASQGVFCRASHAVFPTATRVNSASLTTGCHPGRHGIVDNELYVPTIDGEKAVSCEDWNVLQTMADLEGRRVVDGPTMGELLWAAGKTMASAGSGSTGTTYLTNPTVTGPVVNWATAWPSKVRIEIKRRYGSFLGPESTSSQQNQFIYRAVSDYLIPIYRPHLITIWLTEPDHTFHEHGLSSPKAMAVLAQLDRQLEHLLRFVEHTRAGEDLTCLFLSDHGFSTVSQRVNVDQELAELQERVHPRDIVRTSNSLYLKEGARGSLCDILQFLLSKPWVGALFLRDDLMDQCPEAMPQSAVFGTHRRSGEIMFAPSWFPEDNDDGVPGCVTGSPSLTATHGSASPYAIENCLVAWGVGIKEGLISSVPCGIMDIAPTVLHLLGIEIPQGMDGRPLLEIFEGGPCPEELKISHETRESSYRTAAGPRRQVARYSIVDGHRYLNQVTLDP